MSKDEMSKGDRDIMDQVVRITKRTADTIGDRVSCEIAPESEPGYEERKWSMHMDALDALIEDAESRAKAFPTYERILWDAKRSLEDARSGLYYHLAQTVFKDA